MNLDGQIVRPAQCEDSCGVPVSGGLLAVRVREKDSVSAGERCGNQLRSRSPNAISQNARMIEEHVQGFIRTRRQALNCGEQGQH